MRACARALAVRAVSRSSRVQPLSTRASSIRLNKRSSWAVVLTSARGGGVVVAPGVGVVLAGGLVVLAGCDAEVVVAALLGRRLESRLRPVAAGLGTRVAASVSGGSVPDVAGVWPAVSDGVR